MKLTAAVVARAARACVSRLARVAIVVPMVCMAVDAGGAAGGGNDKAPAGDGGGGRRPNVLVLMGDDHAAYAMGAYGSRLARTPHLDALAAQGVRFDRAYCNSPVCTASRQSLLTGKLPHSIGVTLLKTPLPEEEVTLAEHLKRFGYQTAALGKMHFNGPARHGFDVRIDTPEYDRSLVQHPPRRVPEGMAVLPTWGPFRDPARVWLNGSYLAYGRYEADMEGTFLARQAVEFMTANRERPFYLVTSFQEPHSPFRFPIEYRGMYDPAAFSVPLVGPEDDPQIPQVFRGLGDDEKRRIAAAYYTSAAFLDKNVGVVLEGLARLGLERDTVVVYLGDHGYMLGEHGRFEKHCFYEPAVRAPLVWRWSGRLSAGRTVKGLVEFIDVMPTILELCGVAGPAGLQGRSLVALLRGETEQGREYVFSEYLENEEAMIRTESWKLVYTTGRRERQDGYTTGRPLTGRVKRLYDMIGDSGEMTNLAGRPEYGSVVAELQRKLLDRLTSTQKEPEKVPQGVSEEEVIDGWLVPRDKPAPQSRR